MPNIFFSDQPPKDTAHGQLVRNGQEFKDGTFFFKEMDMNTLFKFIPCFVWGSFDAPKQS